MYGKLIIFEGIDGSGKSTNVLKLVEYLNKNHCPTLHTYEPYGSFITTTIYDILYNRIPLPDARVMATLFTAARMHHIEHIIKPALKDGLNVVCDRYIFSTFAYNSSPEITREAIEVMHQEFYYPPDHIFFLDCSPVTAIERLITRGKQSIFEADVCKLTDVCALYLAMLYGQEAIYVCGQKSIVHYIDANLTPGKVFKQIAQIIDPLIRQSSLTVDLDPEIVREHTHE